MNATTLKKLQLVENLSNEELLKNYVEIQAELKKLNKIEENLKDQIKLTMGDLSSLGAGDYVATLQERSRSSVDQKLLKELVGEEILKEATKTTQYKVLTVVKA